MTVFGSKLQIAKLQPATDVPIIRIEPSRGWVSLKLPELWVYRQLIYFLIWRDVKVRYKQTLIGAAWAILQPLLTVLIFTFFFGRLVKVPSDGLPYPVFALAAVLPWNYFSQAITHGGESLVGSSHLISKVYFPRLIIPISAAVAPLVDFAIAFVVLLGLMAWYGIVPTWGVLALPLFVFLTLLTALAVGLWLSALNVRYRDVRYAIPFLTQIWMFVSPVIYPVSLIPERWRPLYSLNPMAGVIEGFRWALLGKESPDFRVIALSAAVVIVLLFTGAVYFKRMERTFADVV